MRIKVDENIGASGVDLLRKAGQDTMTVREQELAGAADEVVFEACIAEGRTLVTLDRDFGQVLRFPPTQTAGVVVLELGGRASVSRLLGRLQGFLTFAATRPVVGELWIIEPGRVRVHLEKTRTESAARDSGPSTVSTSPAWLAAIHVATRSRMARSSSLMRSSAFVQPA